MNALLFGFGGQSGDDFRFRYNQFRVHAVLEDSNGRKLECIRRKGNKDTLRKDCDKEVLAEQHLTQFIGGLDERQFEQLFGLDALRLRKVSDDIASNKRGDKKGGLAEGVNFRSDGRRVRARLMNSASRYSAV